MRLRRAIPGCIVHRHGLYRLARHVEIDSDVAQFETLIQSARNATLEGDRLQLYEEAIALYRGDYFEECYSDWCEEARAVAPDVSGCARRLRDPSRTAR